MAERVGGDGDAAGSRIRAAKNQALFREVNERIQALRQPSTFVEFICECSRADCDEKVEMTHQEYDTLRSSSNRFAVKPGHGVRGLDVLVVDHAQRFEEVEKVGRAKHVVNDLDPRST